MPDAVSEDVTNVPRNALAGWIAGCSWSDEPEVGRADIELLSRLATTLPPTAPIRSLAPESVAEVVERVRRRHAGRGSAWSVEIAGGGEDIFDAVDRHYARPRERARDLAVEREQERADQLANLDARPFGEQVFAAWHERAQQLFGARAED